MNESVNTENGPKLERRAVSRAATLRKALFSAFMDGGGLFRGTAVDISPNGIQIRTQRPEKVGRQIEIELGPRPEAPEADPIVVRGRVIRADLLDGGEYAMGVRFMMSFPQPGPETAPRLTSKEEVKAALLLAAEQLRGLRADSPSPLAYAEHFRGEEVQFKAIPVQEPEKRRRWAKFLAVAVLLLLLAIPSCIAYQYRRPGPMSEGYSNVNPPAPVPVEPAQEKSGASGTEDLNAWAQGRSPAALLSRGQSFLAVGKPEAASVMFNALLTGLTGTPIERFVAQVGQAQALAGQGEKAQSLIVLSTALNTAEGIPAPWREMARELREQLARGGDAAPMPVLRETLDIGVETPSEADSSAPGKAPEPPADTASPPSPAPPSEPAAATPAAAGGGAGNEEDAARLEVDTSEYTLTLFRGNKVAAVFAVGLGRDDATPLGEFYIANKIEHPDWYNRGKVVKAGDPANPLGAYWMGLGVGGKATSYGIHPTNEPESIGKNKSRGCIRMRPSDAAKVFKACPIGTPVIIQP